MKFKKLLAGFLSVTMIASAFTVGANAATTQSPSPEEKYASAIEKYIESKFYSKVGDSKSWTDIDELVNTYIGTKAVNSYTVDVNADTIKVSSSTPSATLTLLKANVLKDAKAYAASLAANHKFPADGLTSDIKDYLTDIKDQNTDAGKLYQALQNSSTTSGGLDTAVKNYVDSLDTDTTSQTDFCKIFFNDFLSKAKLGDVLSCVSDPNDKTNITTFLKAVGKLSDSSDLGETLDKISTPDPIVNAFIPVFVKAFDTLVPVHDKITAAAENFYGTVHMSSTDLSNGIKGLDPSHPDPVQAGQFIVAIGNLTPEQQSTFASTPDCTTLETALEAICAPSIPTPTVASGSTIATVDQMTKSPSVPNLCVAAGATNTDEKVTLTTAQKPVSAGELLKFDISLTMANKAVPIHDQLNVPVTVTFYFPQSFNSQYSANNNYFINHTYTRNGSSGTEKLSLSVVYDDTAKLYKGTFTTLSFSDFAVTASAKTNPTPVNPGGSTNPTNPTNPADTFKSDTTSDLSVNGAYTFKITSENGKAPVFVVGTPSVFSMQLVKQSGNDYFYKITATGPVGAQAGIYVNGTKLLVATVKTTTRTFVSDTNSNLSVNGAYTFKITSKNGKAPNFVVGTPGAFDVKLVKRVGSDYYIKITAVGAPGMQSGIYINGGSRFLVATIGSNPSYVKSDTTCSFKVKAGKSYVFKLTGNAKPSFVAGTGSAFKVSFVKQSGKDYFFRVTAVGKAGQASGFYINHQGRTAIATIY